MCYDSIIISTLVDICNLILALPSGARLFFEVLKKYQKSIVLVFKKYQGLKLF